jgi:hypothetical protein
MAMAILTRILLPNVSPQGKRTGAPCSRKRQYSGQRDTKTRTAARQLSRRPIFLLCATRHDPEHVVRQGAL